MAFAYEENVNRQKVHGTFSKVIELRSIFERDEPELRTRVVAELLGVPEHGVLALYFENEQEAQAFLRATRESENVEHTLRLFVSEMRWFDYDVTIDPDAYVLLASMGAPKGLLGRIIAGL